jgi:hypothetical protein
VSYTCTAELLSTANTLGRIKLKSTTPAFLNWNTHGLVNLLSNT